MQQKSANFDGAGLFYMNEDDFITDMSKKLFTFHL